MALPVSALGQSRHFERCGWMSAFTLIVTAKADIVEPGGRSNRAALLPGALRFRPAPILPERRQYQCPDIAPCSQSSCVQVEAEPHVDCLCGGRSVWPLSAAANACRRRVGQVQSQPTSPLEGAH